MLWDIFVYMNVNRFISIILVEDSAMFLVNAHAWPFPVFFPSSPIPYGSRAAVQRRFLKRLK